jgi:hypothetical protein
MNINQNTIDSKRSIVLKLIKDNDFKEALSIAAKYPLKTGHKDGFVICKTRLLKTYNVTEYDLSELHQVQVKNPHYSNSSPMILFLEAQVNSKFQKR